MSQQTIFSSLDFQTLGLWASCFRPAEAVVQCVLETDQFTEQSVVTAVSLGAFAGQELIEGKFRTGLVRGFGNQASTAQTRAGDAHQTSGNGSSACTEVIESLPDLIRAGETVQQAIREGVAAGVTCHDSLGTLQASSTLARNEAGSRAG